MSTGDAGAVIGTIITDVMTVAGATEFSDDADILERDDDLDRQR